MTDFLTSSEIVTIEDELRAVDPRLLGDPAMLTAMAIRLDETDEAQADVRHRIANYVAFRWPALRRSLVRSLTHNALKGALLTDARHRKATTN